MSDTKEPIPGQELPPPPAAPETIRRSAEWRAAKDAANKEMGGVLETVSMVRDIVPIDQGKIQVFKDQDEIEQLGLALSLRKLNPGLEQSLALDSTATQILEDVLKNPGCKLTTQYALPEIQRALLRQDDEAVEQLLEANLRYIADCQGLLAPITYTMAVDLVNSLKTAGKGDLAYGVYARYRPSSRLKEGFVPSGEDSIKFFFAAKMAVALGQQDDAQAYVDAYARANYAHVNYADKTVNGLNSPIAVRTRVRAKAALLGLRPTQEQISVSKQQEVGAIIRTDTMLAGGTAQRGELGSRAYRLIEHRITRGFGVELALNRALASLDDTEMTVQTATFLRNHVTSLGKQHEAATPDKQPAIAWEIQLTTDRLTQLATASNNLLVLSWAKQAVSELKFSNPAAAGALALKLAQQAVRSADRAQQRLSAQEELDALSQELPEQDLTSLETAGGRIAAEAELADALSEDEATQAARLELEELERMLAEADTTSAILQIQQRIGTYHTEEPTEQVQQAQSS